MAKFREMAYRLLVSFILSGYTSAVAQQYATGSCSEACDHLGGLLGFATTPPPYWAQQQSAISAACYIRPTTSEGVSTVLRTAKQYSCPFAIRGAGHSDVPGASNAPNGITLDLGALQETTLINNNTVTRVGAGRTWGDVYSILDLHNLTVIGGREKSVGVAGLTLGGGVSYFSALHGLACDNVVNYEVVLADGTIAQVNSSSPYRDIYRALRGGGNNFGIVTRFDLDTYPYNLIRGGLNVWASNNQTTSTLIAAYANYTINSPSSPSTAMFLAQGFSSTTKSFLWSAGLYEVSPDLALNASAPIFAPFSTSELNSARVLTTERTTTHFDLASELDATQPPNLRNQFTTATFVMSAELIQRMVTIFRQEVLSAVTANISSDPAFSPTLAFQPLTSSLLQHQSRRGGNTLGLRLGATGSSDEDQRPLMLMNFDWQWSNAAFDSLVQSHIANIVERSTQAAKELGLYNEYIYMNYASPTQQPVASYGEANREFMRSVQARWDPEGVFQKLVPGGFKVV